MANLGVANGQYEWRKEYGSAFEGEHVLVTGATGFVGGHLCQALVALGAEVHALSLTATKKTVEEGCIPWSTDLADLGQTLSTLRTIRAPLVFHLAGLVTARQDVDMTEAMLQNNLVASVHLLSAVKEVGCRRLVFVGSPKEPPSPAWEDAVDSTYSASKASAAIYARLFHRLYGVPLVMPRPLLIYGPAQPADKLVPYTIVSLLSGTTPQYTNGSLVVDFVYVLDIVRGLLHSAIGAGLEGQSPDIGTGIGSRVSDVVQQLFDLMGHDEQPRIGDLPDRKFERPHIADLETTRRLMGWEPLWPLQQGLLATVDWYKAHWKEMASAK